MPYRVVIFAAVALAASLAQPALADWCKHRDSKSESIPTEGAERVEIRARAGELDIRGAEDARELSVDAKLCAAKAAGLAEMELIVERRGAVLYVESKMSNGSSWRDQRLMDLEISLPPGLPVDVSDSSGDIEIHNVAGLQLDDSSGDIEISRVTGNVDVDDSSGGVQIFQVTGDVRVDDSSGDVDITEVAGNVTVRDSSGDIEVARVAGDFTVERDGSGDVDYAEVAGEVDVPEDRRKRRRRL